MNALHMMIQNQLRKGKEKIASKRKEKKRQVISSTLNSSWFFFVIYIVFLVLDTHLDVGFVSLSLDNSHTNHTQSTHASKRTVTLLDFNMNEIGIGESGYFSLTEVAHS